MALNDNFQFIVERFGRPEGFALQPTDPDITAYQDVVPPSLLEFWKECGYGKVLDGYFQFCNPTSYQPLVDQIFEGDADFDPKLICPVGFSAFGRLLLWHKEFFTIKVDLVNLEMSCKYFFNKHAEKYDADVVIASALNGLDARANDENDENGKPLFKRTLAKLGSLQLGNIYGFKPALALGGSPILKNLVIYSAFEHMSLLSQLGEIQLRDYSHPG